MMDFPRLQPNVCETSVNYMSFTGWEGGSFEWQKKQFLSVRLKTMKSNETLVVLLEFENKLTDWDKIGSKPNAEL